MVHRGLGSARITYPTTVQLSPADPMTSASLPPRLLAVPGVVSRPIRLSGVQQSEAALIALMQQRMANPTDLGLRDREHAAFSQYLIDKLGPVLGRAVVATSVPMYSGGKLIIQSMGGMKGATPPSFREIAAGLRPLVKAGPTITSYQTVGVWPGAVVSTAAQCAAYLATHGGGPGSGCRPLYSDGTTGPVTPYVPVQPSTAPNVLKAPFSIHPMARPGYRLAPGRLGYYPNLGQYGDATGAPAGGIPTWVWWVAGYGALALLLGGFFYGTPARRQPSVRTVTRTTY